MSPVHRFMRGIASAWFLLPFLWFLGFAPHLSALPQKLGDLDEDGVPTVVDLAVLVNHVTGASRLSNEMAVFADLNQDGVVNNLDEQLLLDAILGLNALPELPLTRILDSSPINGESGVGVTRETVIRFTGPLSTTTLITLQNLYAEFGGQKLVARVELASDRRQVSLFYAFPLPGSARVRVTFKGDSINDFAGRRIDAYGDGQPGGTALIDFCSFFFAKFRRPSGKNHN